MFSQACVCQQGGAWSRRVPGPRGGAWLGGSGPGGGVGIPACTEADHPWERWLLLWTVHILLECILVSSKCTYICNDFPFED